MAGEKMKIAKSCVISGAMVAIAAGEWLGGAWGVRGYAAAGEPD